MPSEDMKVYCDGGLRGEVAWVIRTPSRLERSYARISRLEPIELTEAYAILRALSDIPSQSTVKVFSDSRACVGALKNVIRLKDEIQKVIDKISSLSKQKNLSIEYEWIPRKKNLAGALIERTHQIWFKHILGTPPDVGFFERSFLEESVIPDEDDQEFLDEWLPDPEDW